MVGKDVVLVVAVRQMGRRDAKMCVRDSNANFCLD